MFPEIIWSIGKHGWEKGGVLISLHSELQVRCRTWRREDDHEMTTLTVSMAVRSRFFCNFNLPLSTLLNARSSPCGTEMETDRSAWSLELHACHRLASSCIDRPCTLTLFSSWMNTTTNSHEAPENGWCEWYIESIRLDIAVERKSSGISLVFYT